jgi:hypothetical protein
MGVYVLKYIAALFISIALFASMVINIDVKETKNLVELLLNFDAPFSGKILQKQQKDKVVLILKNVTILDSWQKKLDTNFIYQIDITPLGNDSKITLFVVDKVRVFAAKSKDNKILKIRVKPPKNMVIKEDNKVSFFDNIKDYLIWIAIALLVIFLLLLLLKIVFSRKKPVESKRVIVKKSKNSEFNIKFEKPLDERNKIALISFKGMNYLVIIGSSNILLQKFKEGEIKTREDFERVVKEQDISNIKDEKIKEDDIFTTIEEYKKRASGEI